MSKKNSHGDPVMTKTLMRKMRVRYQRLKEEQKNLEKQGKIEAARGMDTEIAQLKYDIDNGSVNSEVARLSEKGVL